MKIVESLFFHIFKDSAIEAIMLDSYLNLFADGVPKQDVPSMEGEDVWNQIRIDRKLMDDKYLLPWEVWYRENYIIRGDGFYKRRGIQKGIVLSKNHSSKCLDMYSIFSFISDFVVFFASSIISQYNFHRSKA